MEEQQTQQQHAVLPNSYFCHVQHNHAFFTCGHLIQCDLTNIDDSKQDRPLISKQQMSVHI